MSNPEAEAGTPRLDDPVSESAAALNAYLSGSGAFSPPQHGSAILHNGTGPVHPIITPPERHRPAVTASLAGYIVAALLFSIAVREAALAMRRMVFPETTIPQIEEPANLQGGEGVPPPAISEDKAAGKPASAPAGKDADVTAMVSSPSAGDKDSQSQATGPAQPITAETKPWSETVKAFKQLSVEHRAVQAERWKPQ
jgi:hypothetical protein